MKPLTKARVWPTLKTCGFKRLGFTSGYALWPVDFRDETSPFGVTGPDGELVEKGPLDAVWKHVKGMTSSCMYCQPGALGPVAATVRMPDGYLVCAKCAKAVQPYYQCEECQKPLTPGLGGFARDRIERMVCGAKLCQQKRDVRWGRICCLKARRIPCVCERAYKCPDHCPNGIHVGTHD